MFRVVREKVGTFCHFMGFQPACGVSHARMRPLRYVPTLAWPSLADEIRPVWLTRAYSQTTSEEERRETMRNVHIEGRRKLEPKLSFWPVHTAVPV